MGAKAVKKGTFGAFSVGSELPRALDAYFIKVAKLVAGGKGAADRKRVTCSCTDPVTEEMREQLSDHLLYLYGSGGLCEEHTGVCGGKVQDIMRYTYQPPISWFEPTAKLIFDMRRSMRSEVDALMTGTLDVGQDRMEYGEYSHIDDISKAYEGATDGLILTRTGPIKTLIITGIETDMCVLTTVLQAQEAGYRVLIVEDAVAAGTFDEGPGSSRGGRHKFLIDHVFGKDKKRFGGGISRHMVFTVTSRMLERYLALGEKKELLH